MNQEKGILYVVSAPSGAGKTTLVHALQQEINHIVISTSYTTRLKRAGEMEGLHYHFISKEAFEKRIIAGNFLEYAQVFDHFYGTSINTVQKTLHQGWDVILEIDWQGARQVREKMPQAQTIFILPPSKQALKDRLQGRGQDSATIIQRRMQDAEKEMSHYTEFDYIVINDKFSDAVQDLKSIFRCHQLQQSLKKFLL